MSVGEDEFDRLAHALVVVEYDFDAVEVGMHRAEWTEDGSTVVVTDGTTEESRSYAADELMIATSDREVKQAREGSSKPP